MKYLRLILLVLVLEVFSASAGAQDKSSKPYSIVVGHVVTLNWTASTSLGVFYRVYVGGFGAGPFTKIAETTALEFSDLNATSGNTYFYVVTAVDTSGTESVFSNQVSVQIPTP